MLLLGTGFAVLRIKLDGPELGDKLASFLNKRMRGRIEIGSVEWPTAALKAVVAGGWVPITVRDVRVWDDCALSAELSDSDLDEHRTGDPNEDCTPDDRPDPDVKSPRKPRKLLLSTPLITAEIDVHAIMFGNHDFVFRHLWIRGGEALIEQTREPYPLHAYDRTIVSIVTAFYPRMKAGFRAGIYADAPPPTFDLRDIHVEDLNVTVHTAPYKNRDGTVGFGMAARIESVNIDAGAAPRNDASLHMNATDPLVAKFYVRLGLTGKHAYVRILDEGPRAAFRIPGGHFLEDTWAKGRSSMYELELSDLELRRIAQVPSEWPRHDFVARTLELELTAHSLPCKSATGGAPSPKDGAALHVRGELQNYWDRPYDGQWNLTLTATNLGPTVRTCIKSTLGGDNLGGQITMTGPFIALPKVTLDLHDLDFDVPLSAREEPVRLTLAEVHGEVDLVNDQGSIEKTKALVRNGKEPGEVMVSATFGVKPYNATASVDITKPIDVGRFLPGSIASAVGKYLSGKLTVGGDIDKGFELTNFALALGATPTDRAAKVYSGRIFTRDHFDLIVFEKIRLEAGKTFALINGAIEYVGGQFVARNLRFEHTSDDLDVWLKRLQLPVFATRANGGTTVINGPIKHPTITTQNTLAGVPCIDNLKLDATVKNGVVDLSLSTAGLGGSLKGTGRFDPASQMIERFAITGAGIDGSKLCGLGGAVKGTLDTLQVDVKRTAIVKNRQPIEWLGFVSAFAKSSRLAIAGDPVSDFAVCVNRSGADDDKLCRPRSQGLTTTDVSECELAKKTGGFCAVATANRDQGGRLDATIANVPASRAGRGVIPAHLGGLIALDDVPMAILDPLVGKGTLGGLLSARLHLAGTAKPLAPQAEGAIDFLRGWVKDAFVGDSHLQVDPIMVGKLPGIAIRGGALAGQLGISATIGTVAPYPVDVALSGRRLEVDQFVDLQKALGLREPVQLWASGTVTVHTELAPLDGKPAKPEAWVEVTELEAIVTHRSNDGRLVPLRLALVPGRSGHYAMSLRVTPSTIALACRNPSAAGGSEPCQAQLLTPAGIVSVEGNATAAAMHLHASGDLELRKLQPLFESQLDSIAGVVALDANVNGTFDKPSYDVELAVKNSVIVKLGGSDTELQILGPRRAPDPDAPDGTIADLPGAQVKLTNGNLGFNSFTINVKDEHKDEQGELHVKGTIGFDGVKPQSWGMLIDGKIAGKMLLAVAPNALAQASGLARIDGDLVLSGHGALPLVNGTIVFDPVAGQTATPIMVTPRGVHHEIALLAGSMDIATSASRTYTLSVASDSPLSASIDGEGRLQHITANVDLRDGVPSSARVKLDAENVTFRTGDRNLDLSLAAKGMELSLDNGAWSARGDIALVSGTYHRNFELTDAIKPAPPVVAPARPFWDEYPSIGNATLDLTLDVRRFAVDNNIAQIELAGQRILISGSPRDPRLSGSISVQHGEFKIPATRAKFTRTIGSIDFAENEHATNPLLNVTSDAPDYVDLSGQPHVITLTITGTLEQPQWDLKTSTGFNKSQTLALLFLGRNPEQLRRTLGDQSLGADPTRIDPTTNPSTGFADQVVKDLAGDWVSGLFGGQLTKLTQLDVMHFEIGFGSVGVYAEKKVFENIKGIGNYEQTIRGNTTSVRVELKTPYHLLKLIDVIQNDRITVQAGYLQKNYSDPADQAQNIQDLQGKLVYRLFIP